VSDDAMKVDEVVEGLLAVLPLQARSAVHQTAVASSLSGLQFQGVAEQIWGFAQLELRDLRLLTAKLVALGGQPDGAAAEYPPVKDPEGALDDLITAEEQVIRDLHALIEKTGEEPRSEAMEHLLEHALQRKQEQVDWLRRALGASAA
jgi:bacterioferritin (cytochrome b1)